MIYNESKFNTEWDTLPLSKLGKFKRGKSKHRPRNDKKLFEGGIYPLVQTGEIKAANLLIKSHSANYNDEGLKQSKMWPAGTLVITIAANIAETGILAYPMCFPDSCVGFIADKEKTSELFMHYVFTYIKRSIQNSAVGSIQDNINVEMLTALNFKIPKKPIQDLIVDLLATIDYKIELNNDINTELENLAKTIYNYWFVQFDFPNEEGKPYKTSGGEMVWNEELKREIPKGWEVHTLKKNPFTEIIKPGIEYFRGEKIYIETADVSNLSINFDASITNFENRTSRANMQPIVNSVWFAKMKNSRKIIYVGHYSKYLLENMIFSTGFLGLHCKDSTMEYILSFIMNDDFEIIKDRLANGATQQAINNDSLDFIPIIIPDKDTVNKYHNVVHPIFETIYKNLIQNQELIKLRDFLLPLLMNGQVKIKSEATEQLSMAAEPQVKYGK